MVPRPHRFAICTGLDRDGLREDCKIGFPDYSNTLGWNTFPVPRFTEDQLEALTASARAILKTRYMHHPKTIAQLYDPDNMPDDLRAVHRRMTNCSRGCISGVRSGTTPNGSSISSSSMPPGSRSEERRGRLMIDLVRMTYGHSGATAKTNSLGQRPMQARVYEARAAQFLLLKAPPAAGKSRALMFVALDKLENQGVNKVIVAVPETSIGASFRSTDLTSDGFLADWKVEPRWNLCIVGRGRHAKSQKVKAFEDFMDERRPACIVCTHATFRFAFDAIEKERASRPSTIASSRSTSSTT